MSQTKNYQKTIYACFVAYMVQAVVNNFVPLLFVTFEETYGLPLSKITALVTFNFGIQLILDATSAGFVDKIGYRASMLIANTCAAAGLVLLTILPDLTPDPFVGILIAVMIYAVGGGLMEVLVSPIVEACPTDNKEARGSQTGASSPPSGLWYRLRTFLPSQRFRLHPSSRRARPARALRNLRAPASSGSSC